MKERVFCTVFTPTYNRALLLEKLYQSLLRQQDKDFEWLIVDDGSIDCTEDVVKKFIAEKKIKIIFFKQKNGGKHRAINYGLKNAHGFVFSIVDSDDYLTDDAIKKIKDGFNEIRNNGDILFAGIAFQKGFGERKSVGTSFNDSRYIDAKSTERNKYNISGDKFEIFYTDILKKYPFPEFENEKFMTEAIVWTRIANAGYYLRWYNNIIYICDYLEGGLTDSRDKLVESSPHGYALYIQEQVQFGNINLKQKLGFYSYYANIRMKTVQLRVIAKELKTSILTIYISIVLRKIINLLRRIK